MFYAVSDMSFAYHFMYNHRCKQQVTDKDKEMIFMKSVQVSLNSIDKVKGFVNVVSKFDNKFELISDKYSVNAKSIMGIFCLNLAKPLCLNIHVEGNIDHIMNAINYYII